MPVWAFCGIIHDFTRSVRFLLILCLHFFASAIRNFYQTYTWWEVAFLAIVMWKNAALSVKICISAVLGLSVSLLNDQSRSPAPGSMESYLSSCWCRMYRLVGCRHKCLRCGHTQLFESRHRWGTVKILPLMFVWCFWTITQSDGSMLTFSS